jgi:hypothetical protein
MGFEIVGPLHDTEAIAVGRSIRDSHGSGEHTDGAGGASARPSRL